MYDEEHDKWVDKKLRWALGQDQEETRPVEGQNESPQDENQPSTDDEGLNFKSINQDQLVKFVEISETMAPQYGIGLKGIKLTEAIILAIPGFIAGLRGGWHPVGL